MEVHAVSKTVVRLIFRVCNVQLKNTFLNSLHVSRVAVGELRILLWHIPRNDTFCNVGIS